MDLVIDQVEGDIASFVLGDDLVSRIVVKMPGRASPITMICGSSFSSQASGILPDRFASVMRGKHDRGTMLNQAKRVRNDEPTSYDSAHTMAHEDELRMTPHACSTREQLAQHVRDIVEAMLEIIEVTIAVIRLRATQQIVRASIDVTAT